MTLPARRRRRIVAVGAVLLLLVAAELLARALVRPRDIAPVRLQRVLGAQGESGTWPGWPLALETLLRPDDRLEWRLRPEVDHVATGQAAAAPRPWRVETSMDGYRTAPLALLDATRPLLLVLGGSAAFGWGIDQERVAAAQLADLLDQDWQVRNLGVPGYSVVQVQAQLREHHALPPAQAVVLAIGDAESRRVLLDDHEREQLRDAPGRALARSVRDLRLRQLLAPPLARLSGQLLTTAEAAGRTKARVSPDDFRAALDRLRHAAPRTILLDVCADQDYGQVMADLAETSPQLSLLRYADLHGETLDGCNPSAQGHAAIAGAVASALADPRPVGHR